MICQYFFPSYVFFIFLIVYFEAQKFNFDVHFIKTFLMNCAFAAKSNNYLSNPLPKDYFLEVSCEVL